MTLLPFAVPDAIDAWLILALLAPIIGSFMGVLVRRLPRGVPLARARSCCESCGVRLAARDLVPIVSYLALRGRCRVCDARIAPFHIHIELAAIVIVLVAMLADPRADGPSALIDCGLGWTLLTLAWIDIDHMVLPDVLTLPLLLAGLALAWPDDAAILTRAAGAAVGYLAFRAIAAGYRMLRGRAGMGAGDAKLLAAGGAWLGLSVLPYIILLAAVIGIASAIVLARRGHRLTGATAVPFGPALACAIWVLWFLTADS